MRTLLIPPAFIAIYIAAIFSMSWLITESAQRSAIRNSDMATHDSFVTWMENMPVRGPFDRMSASPAHERIEEIGMF